ncbi:MAG: hypothetical protein ABFE07_28685 [Armatimonadia bacterium]
MRSREMVKSAGPFRAIWNFLRHKRDLQGVVLPEDASSDFGRKRFEKARRKSGREGNFVRMKLREV